MKIRFVVCLVLSVLVGAARVDAAESQKLVNVSFGFTKAFYADYNRWFAEKWRRDTGNAVVIEQSHGPSGTQTEAVIQGKLVPDVVSLASPSDLDAISKKAGLIASDWRNAFPNSSSPYYSAVVFLVRPGNPKQIKDWQDLALPDRSLVTSNPKACGGGRWNYVAAFGLGAGADVDPSKKQDYLSAFLKNVPVLYANQGEAGEAFLKSGQGDVLLTYESFALSLAAGNAPSAELVVPPRTVEIELPVAVVRKNAEKNKTTKLAQAYLAGLYAPEAQELFVKHHFRPRVKAVAARTAPQFPALKLVRAKEVFGAQVEREQLSDGGNFDVLSSTRPAPSAKTAAVKPTGAK